MKKRKIVFEYSKLVQDRYLVIRLQNLIEPAIGRVLGPKEVENYISNEDIEVEIVPTKGK